MTDKFHVIINEKRICEAPGGAGETVNIGECFHGESA